MTKALVLLWPIPIAETTEEGEEAPGTVVPEYIKTLLGDYEEAGQSGDKPYYLQATPAGKRQGCVFFVPAENGWWLTDGGKPSVGKRVAFASGDKAKVEGEVPYTGWQTPGFFGKSDVPLVASLKEVGTLTATVKASEHFLAGVKTKSAQRLEDLKGAWETFRTTHMVTAKEAAVSGGAAAAEAAKSGGAAAMEAAKQATVSCKEFLNHPDTIDCFKGAAEVARSTVITVGMVCMQGVIKLVDLVQQPADAEKKEEHAPESAPEASPNA
mmetsp:Transcript_67372/g.161564  ORF Transcript_67372/g.161564 Transcript_67372/m.161564 type:complete len:269 (-) Transcript_67372:56-862(-)|eukprot:CAMPEP_0178440300 /NCGR_PEP_ID=MMETSP0689_2-20121128/36689_1 /TAXON_ID=160604 /ORGANISM="Amphidinium massartii, Strain CS-259" /LENGTH=268 /DNA_ID=CAMNT_0020063033 /DNA_START=79 /DNA_END=885 /DNA_ORIENTATION=-